MITKTKVLLGTVKTNKKGKLKKANIYKLYRYLFNKIFASLSTILILVLTLIYVVISPIIFFLISTDVYSTINNLQFFILLFYCIFLYLYILLISIKLFGNQIEDNSFLLVLTKPYSRRTIIFVQYLVIYFSTLFLIMISVIIFLVLGDIFIVSKKLNLIIFFNKLCLKLFLFSLLFSFLLINSVVFLVTLFNTRVVFLIFSIFCSLFILGGLPYTLIKYKIENITFNFTDSDSNVSLSLRKVNQAITFKKFLENNLIKYPNLTKAIFDDFYNKWDFTEIKDFNSQNNQENRWQFYQDLGLIDPNQLVKSFDTNVTSWFDHNDIVGPSTIYLIQDHRFISLSQLQNQISQKIGNIPVENDLLAMINDYKKQYHDGLAGFMNTINIKVNQLMDFVSSPNDFPSIKPANSSYISYKNTSGISKYAVIDTTDITQVFLRPNDYVFGQKERDEFNNLFLNPVFFAIRSLEDSVKEIVLDLDYLRNDSLKQDINGNVPSFEKYQNIMHEYQIINKFNVFEHFCQLWTFLLGYYGDYYFDPNLIGEINFDQELNSFFSYPMDVLTINNKQRIEFDNLKTVQNNNVVIYAYVILSCCFYLGSLVVWRYKKIS
ncbi:ABC transporter permease [Spiroplasma endosymbiont of Stenodema calcarata]|uniref:ABC transporter permease n=1 Tax=Spiroplasma endosymbiont of Stenodema calcarata TaxID=3139328 RepID=UPI003CCB6B95